MTTANDPRALVRNARALVNARKANTEHPHRVGIERAQRGDFAGAVQALEQAIGGAADAPWSYLGLGDALVALGRLDDARDAYLRTIEHTPPTALALRESAGNGLVNVGDLESATATFQAILSAEPDRSSTRIALARILGRLGAGAQAEAATLLADLDEVEDPTVVADAVNSGNRHPGLFRLLAKSFAERREHERSIDMCFLALAHDPTDRRSLLLLADGIVAHAAFIESYLEPEPDASHPFARLAQRAFALIDRAADGSSGDVDLAMARARVADVLPDARKVAASSWQVLAHLSPDTPVWQRELGDRLAAIGRFDEAGRAYDRAIALGYTVF